MMKKVMQRAWEIAKEGAKKFSGRAVEYIGEALKLAWKEVKKVVKKVELVGSAKQIAWAEQIREIVFSNMKEFESLLKNTLDEIMAKDWKEFSKERSVKRSGLTHSEIGKAIDEIVKLNNAEIWIDCFKEFTSKFKSRSDMFYMAQGFFKYSYGNFSNAVQELFMVVGENERWKDW